MYLRLRRHSRSLGVGFGGRGLLVRQRRRQVRCGVVLYGSVRGLVVTIGFDAFGATRLLRFLVVLADRGLWQKVASQLRFPNNKGRLDSPELASAGSSLR